MKVETEIPAAIVAVPDAPPAEAPARELETTKPLKLSEAMRLGAMTTAQVFGKLGAASSGEGETCGIGAVLVGLGYGFDGNASWNHVVANNPELKALHVPVNAQKVAGCDHPFGGRTVVDAIIHLNDDHHMPRNEIADRLESLGL